MKKALALLLLSVLLVLSLCGCMLGSDDKDPVRIGGLTGPTSIGLAKVMADNAAGTSAQAYEFTIAGAADELSPKLIQGELDMAAVPANLAAVLHQRTGGDIQILAINTLGVLYMVQKGGDAIESMEDLRGKTIYATSKGTVTEYNLRYLLSQYGLDPERDVTIEWKSEPAEVVALLKTSAQGIAMLPQPYVTVAQTNIPELQVALDLTREWDNLQNGSQMITGTLVVRASYARENPEKIATFLQEYQASATYVKEHVDEASAWVETYVGIKAGIAKKAIPYCNITYIAGADMKMPLERYLQILCTLNPNAVGGAMPGDDFYYVSP